MQCCQVGLQCCQVGLVSYPCVQNQTYSQKCICFYKCGECGEIFLKQDQETWLMSVSYKCIARPLITHVATMKVRELTVPHLTDN